MKHLPFKGILLACDMDGTLLDSKSRLSEENIKAAERFVMGGGLFTIATGRMEFAIRRYAELLPINAPVILYNGALVYDIKTKKPLWQSYLPDEAANLISSLSQEFPELGIEVFQGGNIYILNRNEETENHMKREAFSPIYSTLEKVPKQWYKAILAWKPEKLKEIEEFVKGKMNNYYSVYSEPQFLELLGNGTSKGIALSHLTKILGIKQENVIAVGDNMNDLEMIKYAGTGVAVANAHKELKKAAMICCPHHDEHVVPYIIKWIEEKNMEKDYVFTNTFV